MGFLRKLFGGGGAKRPVDNGFFVYVQCDHCQDKVRLRIQPGHDLNRDGQDYLWHKTIIDNRCFRPIRTVARFDQEHTLTQAEIDGGRFITQAEYEGQEVSETTEE